MFHNLFNSVDRTHDSEYLPGNEDILRPHQKKHEFISATYQSLDAYNWMSWTVVESIGDHHQRGRWTYQSDDLSFVTFTIDLA